jgi:hypothetical protein
MKVTCYNNIILLVMLYSIPSLCSAQENSTRPKRMMLSASVLAKKDLFHSTGTFKNENNLYKLQSKIQPIIAVNLNTRLLAKLSLNTGLQASTSNYSIKRKYRSPELEFNGELRFFVLSYKLPINLQYEISNNFFIGGGIAINNQRLQSISLKSSFEAIDGTYDIKAVDSTVFPGPVITISAQMAAQLRVSKRSSIIFQCDIDFGKYPAVHLTHNINNNGNITNSVFKGSPHLAYVALGYNILLLKM